MINKVKIRNSCRLNKLQFSYDVTNKWGYKLPYSSKSYFISGSKYCNEHFNLFR